MTLLHVRLHPGFSAELRLLAKSDQLKDRKAAAQILHLLDLIRSVPGIRDRLLAHYEDIWVKHDGKIEQVNIRLIQELKKIAEDGRYLTDAVRRIRQQDSHPADEYRVFYVPRSPTGKAFQCEILGVSHRSVAYTPEVLQELKRRYESPEK